MEGTIYSCSLPLLAQHMALSAGRRHLAGLVEAVEATPPPLSVMASLASAASLGSTDFMASLHALSSAWVSVGEYGANILVSRCSHSAAAVCHAVWSTHMDYSRTPYMSTSLVIAGSWLLLSMLAPNGLKRAS